MSAKIIPFPVERTRQLLTADTVIEDVLKAVLGPELVEAVFPTIRPEPEAAKPEPAPFQYMPAYCDPENEFKGEKFERGLNIAEIAKRIRKEILAKKKSGEFPKGLKTSVRISRYSMGQSLDVRVKGFGFDPVNPEYMKYMGEKKPGDDCYGCAVPPRYIEKAEKILATLKDMVEAYNRDNSDSMVDYFDVNFYSDIGVYWEYARELLGEYY